MPLLKTLLALAFVIMGIMFGALNRDAMSIDLFFTTIHASIGLTVLLVLIMGCLLGGLVVLATVVWPMRRALSKAEKASAKNLSDGINSP